MGKSDLVDYGILNEQSDLRAHVSVVGKCIYVYPTKRGIEAIETGIYTMRPAYTGNLQTANGYLVPPTGIRDMRVIPFSDELFRAINFMQTDTTSQKGSKAVRIVKRCIITGNFPFMVNPEIIQDTDLQIQGLDIVVRMKARIQVKCDWRAGNTPGCSGNLYLQVAERNPHKSY